jgi:hypothetical protein
MTWVASRGWGSPLPGPIEAEPLGVTVAEARAMLAASLHGLPLGAYDRRIAAWLAVWDQPTIAVLASLARARRQGLTGTAGTAAGEAP